MKHVVRLFLLNTLIVCALLASVYPQRVWLP